MAKISLQAQTPLRGYNARYGKTCLAEVQDRSIFSIGLALKADGALLLIKQSLGADWPKPGTSSTSDDGNYRLLGLQSDQIFVLVNSPTTPDGQASNLPELADTAYITDQSDSWVGLNIHGDGALSALERVCPIDLHPSAFAIGQVTRTVMEHLAVIILRETDDSYLLLSPSSSALSFVHMLETSIHNTAV